MFEAKRYLKQVLETDLNVDSLYRPGPVTAAWGEEGDALFKADLIRQAPRNDLKRFDNAEPVGEVFLRIRAYSDRVLRVLVTRYHAQFSDESPILQLDPALEHQDLGIAFNEGTWSVRDKTHERLRVHESALTPQISPDGNAWINFQGGDNFYQGVWDALPLLFLDRADGSRTAGFAFHIQPGEHFSGTGERFDRIDLFGRQFDLVNVDAFGVNNERAYKNIPFVISSRPYGLFVHAHAPMRVDLGAHSTRSLQWFVEEDGLDLFLIGGGSLAEILLNYRRLTGFPALPPTWSFGSWMSRMTYHSAEEATAVAGRLRAEGFPMDVIHLDPGWFEREWICNWKFSKERFPDPEIFLSHMQKKGFQVSLWQYPYIHRESTLVNEAIQNDYVGREKDPSNGFELGYTIDFTRPEAAAWYRQLLTPLFVQGAAVIKADFGEEVDEQADYAGIDGRRYRNLFALLYQKAVWEATCQVKGEGNTVIWARSAWAGSQRYPVHWGGDCASTFDGLASSIHGGLHLGLSGFAFWSHDVGGFHGVPDFLQDKPTETLYLRWVQTGTFTSHMRFHGATPREPWEYPGVAPLVREWLRFRYALLPYILSEAEKCTHSGLPMLRALVIDWTGDPTVWSINDEYLFGDSFLVCPVFNDEGIRDVYLPEGKWVDFWSGSVIQGPARLPRTETTLSRIPLFVRFGSAIVYCEPIQHTGQLAHATRFTIPYDDSYTGFESSELSRWIRI